MRGTTSFGRRAVGALAAAGLLAGAIGPSAAKELRAGDRFPELTLPTLDEGEPMSITALRGEQVLVMIWASW